MDFSPSLCGRTAVTCTIQGGIFHCAGPIAGHIPFQVLAHQMPGEPSIIVTFPNVLFGLVFLLLRTTDLIGRQDAGKVKLYQKTSVTALENNDRYVIRSHIFGREVVKGLSLFHFKEPTLVKARIRQSRNRDGS